MTIFIILILKGEKKLNLIILTNFRQDYDVYAENCPNSFLFCDTKFMNSLFARSDDLVFSDSEIAK